MSTIIGQITIARNTQTARTIAGSRNIDTQEKVANMVRLPLVEGGTALPSKSMLRKLEQRKAKQEKKAEEEKKAAVALKMEREEAMKREQEEQAKQQRRLEAEASKGSKLAKRAQRPTVIHTNKEIPPMKNPAEIPVKKTVKKVTIPAVQPTEEQLKLEALRQLQKKVDELKALKLKKEQEAKELEIAQQGLGQACMKAQIALKEYGDVLSDEKNLVLMEMMYGDQPTSKDELLKLSGKINNLTGEMRKLQAMRRQAEIEEMARQTNERIKREKTEKARKEQEEAAARAAEAKERAVRLQKAREDYDRLMANKAKVAQMMREKRQAELLAKENALQA